MSPPGPLWNSEIRVWVQHVDKIPLPAPKAPSALESRGFGERTPRICANGCAIPLWGLQRGQGWPAFQDAGSELLRDCEPDWGVGLGGTLYGSKDSEILHSSLSLCLTTLRLLQSCLLAPNSAFLLPPAYASFLYCLQLTPVPPESLAFGSGCNPHLLADIAPASTRASSTRIS